MRYDMSCRLLFWRMVAEASSEKGDRGSEGELGELWALLFGWEWG